MIGLLLWLVVAAPVPFPWTAGTEAAPGWTVTTVERHAEYVRVYAESADGVRTGVEIVPVRPPAGPYDTALYRVQAAPDTSPPHELVNRFVTGLRAWESSPGHKPLVATQFKVPPPPDAVITWVLSRSFLGEAPLLALLLVAMALALAFATGAAWLAVRPAPGTLPFVVAGLAAVALAALLVDPASLPLDVITPMHEGGTWRGIRRLYADGIHSGPVHQALLPMLRHGAGAALRNLVVANLLLEATALVGVIAMSRSAFGSWPRAVFAGVAWTVQLPVLHAATSELSAALVHVIAVLSFPAVALLARLGEPGAAVPAPGLRSARRLALLQVALCTVLAALTRRELVILAAALPAAVALAAGRRDLLERAHAAARRAVGSLVLPPRGLRTVLAWGVVAALVALEVLRWGTPDAPSVEGFDLSVALAGLSPLNPSVVEMPLITLQLVTPGIVLLALVGVVVAVVRRSDLTLLAVAALVLFRTHHEAGHGTCIEEHLRYATYAWPIIALFSVVGWKTVAAALRRRAHPRFLAAPLALACLIPGPALDRSGAPAAPHTGFDSVLMSRNVQVEGRVLLEALERFPACTFVSRVVESESVLGSDDRTTAWVAFGGPLVRPRVLGRGPQGRSFGDLRAMVGGDCVLVYEGLDCHRLLFPACSPETQGLRPLLRYSFASERYTAIEHTGGYRTPLGLGVWAVPGARPVTGPVSADLATSTPSVVDLGPPHQENP